MSDIGYLVVRTYASVAQYPLQDVAITITATDGTAIAMRLTDRNGQIDPIAIPVPDLSESQSPQATVIPFASVDLKAHKNGYEQVEAKNIQIFSGTVTDQNLEMVPLSEYPEFWDVTETYNTPPQNL